MKGVFEASKKDGSVYYRASITYRSKHISLGSYSNEADAAAAYEEAVQVLSKKTHRIDRELLTSSYKKGRISWILTSISPLSISEITEFT